MSEVVVDLLIKSAVAVYKGVEQIKINREEISSLALRVNLLIGCLTSSDQLKNPDDATKAILEQVKGTLRRARTLISRLSTASRLTQFRWNKDWANKCLDINKGISTYVQLLGVASDARQIRYLHDIQSRLASRREREEDISAQLRLLRQAVADVGRQNNDKKYTKVCLKTLHKTLVQQEAVGDIEEGFIAHKEESDLQNLPPPIKELLLQPEYKSMLLDRSLLSFTESNNSPAGAFGIVHKGLYLGQPVVVKMLLTRRPSLRSIKEILDECLIMKKYNFDFFATVYGICVVNGSPAIVMKRMDSDLFAFLHRESNKEVTSSMAWKVSTSLEVSKAVRALHSLGILHRDLKSPNILVSGKAANPLCITDFGMAKLRREVASMQRQSQIELGKHETVGSYPWMSNEIMEAGRYTTKADIYSLGVIIWEIFTGEEPWKEAVSTRAIERAVLSGRTLPLNGIPESIALLLRHMWSQEPKDRPSAKLVVAELLEFNQEECLGIHSEDHTAATSDLTSATGSSNWGSMNSDVDFTIPASASVVTMPPFPPVTNSHNFETIDTIPEEDVGGCCCDNCKPRRLERTALFLSFLVFVLGVLGIIWAALVFPDQYDDDYTDDEDPGAFVPYSFFCMVTLVSAMVAVPLAYCAGKRYLKTKGLKAKCCLKCLMITGWIFYGLMIANGVAWVIMALLAFASLPAAIFTTCLFWCPCGFMHCYARTARRMGEGKPARPISPVLADSCPSNAVKKTASVSSGRTNNTTHSWESHNACMPHSSASYKLNSPLVTLPRPPPSPPTPTQQSADETSNNEEDDISVDGSVVETDRKVKTKEDGTQVHTEVQTCTHRDKRRSSVKTVVLRKSLQDGAIKQKTTVTKTGVNGERTKSSKTEVLSDDLMLA